MVGSNMKWENLDLEENAWKDLIKKVKEYGLEKWKSGIIVQQPLSYTSFSGIKFFFDGFCFLRHCR